MSKIILASTSPRRKQLMKMIGIPFKAVSVDYEEDMSLKMPPKDLVKFLALGKAESIKAKYPKDIIISADTIVYLKGRAIGKPKSAGEAKRMIKNLSGRTVKVFTGMAVLKGKKVFQICTQADIEFGRISPKEIDWYVKTGEPMDRASAFALQGKGSMFIKKLSGDYFGAVGLPVCELMKILKLLKVKF